MATVQSGGLSLTLSHRIEMFEDLGFDCVEFFTHYEIRVLANNQPLLNPLRLRKWIHNGGCFDVPVLGAYSHCLILSWLDDFLRGEKYDDWTNEYIALKLKFDNDIGTYILSVSVDAAQLEPPICKSTNNGYWSMSFNFLVDLEDIHRFRDELEQEWRVINLWKNKTQKDYKLRTKNEEEGCFSNKNKTQRL